MTDKWKNIHVNVKVGLSFAMPAIPGFKVSKDYIELFLFEHLMDLIEDGAFKPLEHTVQGSFDVPTSVEVYIV